ncbi:MAG: hypothetical protein GY757_40165 [bacterium]|nr:hypothetical protein [bacterium]
MKQHLHKPVPDVRLKSPEIPPEIQGIIETAMAKAPNKRYRHARDLLKEIEKIETPIKEPIDLIQTDKLILSAPITELWSDE